MGPSDSRDGEPQKLIVSPVTTVRVLPRDSELPVPETRAPLWLPALSPGAINAISGATAGIVSGIAVCPLDVVKTTLQVQGSFIKKGEPRKYRGLVGTMKTIVHEEGFRGLYKGLSPMILGYLPTWAIYFYVYGNIQERSAGTVGSNIISAVTAGACSTIATNPIWVVKTRLMTQSKHTDWHYKGVIDAVRTMAREEGPRAFYSGLGSALLGLPHVAIQFPLYEWLKSRLVDEKSSGLWSTMGYLASSILSKIVASTATYPHEVIRSRNQIRSSRQKYRGILRTVRTLWAEEGWRVFYAGMGTNIFRALPASAVTLVTYELVSRYLRRAVLEAHTPRPTDGAQEIQA